MTVPYWVVSGRVRDGTLAFLYCLRFMLKAYYYIQLLLGRVEAGLLPLASPIFTHSLN